MSFRDRMQTNFPRAEEQLDIELQRRKLLRYCHSKGTTIVFHGNGKYIIVPKERLTRDMIAKCLGFTIPDRIISTNYTIAPIYLDGEVHLKHGVKNRDDQIDEMLESCGLTAHRFPYRGKLSQQKLKQIVDEIEGLMKT